MNNKTERLSPWKIFFKNLMASHIVVSFLTIRQSMVPHWFVKCFIVLINCAGAFASCNACNSHPRIKGLFMIEPNSEYILSLFFNLQHNSLFNNNCSTQPHTPFVPAACSDVMLFWSQWLVRNMFKQLVYIWHIKFRHAIGL